MRVTVVKAGLRVAGMAVARGVVIVAEPVPVPVLVLVLVLVAK